MAKTIDLSGYPLASGNHSITVKACADGFDDSAASNAVTYQVSSGHNVTFTDSSSYWIAEYNGSQIDEDSSANYPLIVPVADNAQITLSIYLAGSGNDWYVYLNNVMVAGTDDWSSSGGSYTLTVTSDATITFNSRRCDITMS